VLSFKGVSLEGLEVAVIVVDLGPSGALGSAVIGAAAAVIVLAAVGAATYRLIARIPRRALQLFVGALLSAFGTFWAGLGVGVSRPGGELALLWLAAVLAALLATGGLQRAGLPAWWLLPAAVIGITTVSLRRATKGGRRHPVDQARSAAVCPSSQPSGPARTPASSGPHEPRSYGRTGGGRSCSGANAAQAPARPSLVVNSDRSPVRTSWRSDT
jgi:hypothetical protein